jgi:hypothetical protein
MFARGPAAHAVLACASFEDNSIPSITPHQKFCGFFELSPILTHVEHQKIGAELEEAPHTFGFPEHRGSRIFDVPRFSSTK